MLRNMKFVKIHPTLIINIEHLISIEDLPSNKSLLTMRDGKTIEITDHERITLRNTLEQKGFTI